MRNHIYIIAEAGVNHNGNPEMAFQLVNAAVEAGADAVKFQTFVADNMVTKDALKADYQRNTTDSYESQFAMLKRLELSHDMHHELMQYCNDCNIQFLSTAFDMESLEFLVSDLNVETLKISSGDLTNGPLLLAHAVTGKKLIVSTGMATNEEIEDALAVIAFGLINSSKKPSRQEFKSIYDSDIGQQALREKVTLLHCTSEYPAPFEDINLLAIKTMRETYGLKVGYSDHSQGLLVPISAVSLGASLIEKHFTLDRTLDGPDHMASLEPDELKEMVSSIRKIEVILGDGNKTPRSSEIKNRNIARKSIVASMNIQSGDVFTEKNITIKRPGIGKSPMEYWDLLGEESTLNFSTDELIT